MVLRGQRHLHAPPQAVGEQDRVKVRGFVPVLSERGNGAKRLLAAHLAAHSPTHTVHIVCGGVVFDEQGLSSGERGGFEEVREVDSCGGRGRGGCFLL